MRAVARGRFLAGVVPVLALLVATSSCWRRGGDVAPAAVILVVVDTLRADHLGTYGYTRSTSPELDAWAAESLVFERALATSSWTLPSFGSMLTGQLPARHAAGVLVAPGSGSTGMSAAARVRVDGEQREFAALDASVATLPELLRARGYATGAIFNNTFLSPAWGLARGFQSYDYWPAATDSLRRADVVVDLSLSWIDLNADRPFFLVVHLFDPHMDYDPPAPFRGRFTGAIECDCSLPVAGTARVRSRVAGLSSPEKAFIEAAYDEELLFVDQQLGRLFDALRAGGWLDRALVLVTSDHGEELFDHGGFEHGHTMYQELLHVPLIVRGPGVRRGREATPVSLADLTPTILDALGLETPAPMAGRSLLPLLTGSGELRGRTLFGGGNLYGNQQAAVIEWPWKAVLDLKTGSGQLFDLARDAGERNDVSAQRRHLFQRLSGTIRESIEESRRLVSTPRAVELDPATRERLRGLGYVD